MVTETLSQFREKLKKTIENESDIKILIRYLANKEIPKNFSLSDFLSRKPTDEEILIYTLYARLIHINTFISEAYQARERNISISQFVHEQSIDLTLGGIIEDLITKTLKVLKVNDNEILSLV